MAERRKDDERIDTIMTTVTELKVLVEQVHKAMFGSNGNPGINREFERLKGGLGVWKWMAGSGGGIAVILLVIQIIKFLGE